MDTILVSEFSSCNTFGSIKYALTQKETKTIVKTTRYVKLKVFVQTAINKYMHLHWLAIEPVK